MTDGDLKLFAAELRQRMMEPVPWENETAFEAFITQRSLAERVGWRLARHHFQNGTVEEYLDVLLIPTFDQAYEHWLRGVQTQEENNVLEAHFFGQGGEDE